MDAGGRNRTLSQEPPRTLAAFSNRLADANKIKVIIAVMRKMITTLNAMLRDNAAWQPQSA